MKKLLIYFMTAIACVAFTSNAATAQTTEFTFQGSLKDNAVQANGNYDFEFRLFNASVGGTQQGPTIELTGVAVTNGVFTVVLDFGSQFSGTDRYLAIRVRTSVQGGYTTLTPRQRITTVPYSQKSLYSEVAGSATDSTNLGGLPASDYVLTGDVRLSDARPPTPGSSNYIQNTSTQQAGAAFNIAGNGIVGGNFSVGNTFGLGTSTPNSHFHLKANAPLGFAMQMENTSTASRLYIGNYGSVGGGNHWPALNSANTSFLYAENPLVFTTPSGIYFSGSTKVEHMRIDSNGNVGIGTTHPSEARLVVSTGSGRGVSGTSGATNAAGVFGRGGGPGTVGVEGESFTHFGVRGYSQAVDGTGVYGQGTYSGVSGLGGYGVLGISNTSGGSGLAAQNDSGGNLVVGFSNSVRRFHITNNGTYVAGSDFAEALPALGDRADYEPGDVLVVSSRSPGTVKKTKRPYDARVAGVYSTRPGMLGADKNGTSRVDPADVPVAVVGIVPTKVSAANGAVRVGDMLTTSSIPGYAMRCRSKVKCIGASVGKAMEPLLHGSGIIKVLVNLR